MTCSRTSGTKEATRLLQFHGEAGACDQANQSYGILSFYFGHSLVRLLAGLSVVAVAPWPQSRPTLRRCLPNLGRTTTMPPCAAGTSASCPPGPSRTFSTFDPLPPDAALQTFAA